MTALEAEILEKVSHLTDEQKRAVLAFVEQLHGSADVSQSLVDLVKSKVQVETELTDEGYWLATSPSINVHGTGDTSDEAIKDFVSMMLDLYHELAESENILAPHLADELRYLRELFENMYSPLG